MQICVENVTKIIRSNKVVDNVTAAFESSLITGIRGINGSGKTMLIRLICGLIRPTSGTVTINGKQLHKDISFPESVGILIESPAFLDNYSAFDNLKLIADIGGKIGADDIVEILGAVSLDAADKKKYKHFSLGMKQRLGIAAAIMEKPDIILLDEPTNALDDMGISDFKKLLVKEKERGALTILTCHDFSILKELSDKIYFIENGAIVNCVDT